MLLSINSSDMGELIQTFGGEGALGYNVLATALRDCAEDEGVDIYHFLMDTPKTTLTVQLVDKIRELGYDIINKQ